LVPSFQRPSRAFGVVLNANAGRVTPRLLRRICRIVPKDHVFLTEDHEHAREVVRTCVEREYQTIFAGGGDGTIVGIINLIAALRDQVSHMPAVGVLRLGTGNALARWLGSRGPLDDLRRFVSGDVHRSLPMQMVEAEGTLFPFAGLGYDAALLNDYNDFKKAAADRWYEPLSFGLPGYVLAGVLRSIPNYLFRKNPKVVVTNLGPSAWRLDAEGRPVGGPFGPGEVLYQGSVAMVGAATTPYYGYGIKIFPFAARRKGTFHLRIADVNPMQALWILPSVWKGTVRHSGVLDFFASRIRVTFEEATPYQLGGEARGYRSDITFGLVPEAVCMVGRVA
jgi:diacylglycerol kinase family enzyme